MLFCVGNKDSQQGRNGHPTIATKKKGLFMFSKTSQYYDLIYSSKKYEQEAQLIEELIAREQPVAKTILDVGCGTAEHLKYLSKKFAVSGIDKEPGFVEIAKEKLPSARFWQADMRDFELGLRFDIVLCLFGSIGYLTEPQFVVDALACFKKHLNPGGVIIVEPWLRPDKWEVGKTYVVTVDQPELKISRMSFAERSGDISIINFHYLIGNFNGISHLTETHKLALYTIDEMLGFFKLTGLSVQYDPKYSNDRGLYIAR